MNYWHAPGKRVSRNSSPSNYRPQAENSVRYSLLLLFFNLKTSETHSSLSLYRRVAQTQKPVMGVPPKALTFLHFPIVSLAFFLFLTSSSSQSESEASIYDHLRLNGLPMGLLPKGITEFSIDETTGHFQVNLTQPCNTKFENQLHYDFNISGLLTFGKIGELSGMLQQELFLWFPIKGIRVDVPSSGLIYFDVGVVDKQFSLSLFENPIECTAADPGDETDDSKIQSEIPAHEIVQEDILRAIS